MASGRGRRFGELLPILLLACALLVIGCGDDQYAGTPPPSTVPAKSPTAVDLGRIRSTPRTPFFWLGRSYGGRPLARAVLTAADPPDSIFQYGNPDCQAGVGCSYDIGVATLRKRDPDTTQRCWKALGPAFVLACNGAETVQVYSGAVEVFTTFGPVGPGRLVQALRLKGPGTAAGPQLDGLATPKPFTCEEAKMFPQEFRAALPAALAPAACG